MNPPEKKKQIWTGKEPTAVEKWTDIQMNLSTDVRKMVGVSQAQLLKSLSIWTDHEIKSQVFYIFYISINNNQHFPNSNSHKGNVHQPPAC